MSSYFGGFITGIIVTVIVAYLISSSNSPKDEFTGLTMLSEKGECIKTEGEIEVFQVIKPNIALARTGDYSEGIFVLLINNDGKTYYDEQKITIPDNKMCKTSRDISIYYKKRHGKNCSCCCY